MARAGRRATDAVAVSGAETPGAGPRDAERREHRRAGSPVERQLELSGVSKRFGDTVAVDDLDLGLREGELLTLLGPSGCGKTTVLRLVAGFESPDGGSIRFRGEEILARGPRERGFGMVFQNYALFPHLDVFENVAFGLRSRNVAEEEIGRRVGRVLELVDLPDFGDRAVQELSGGQQQRVALARALAIEPPLLLLDEPLSNLDAALRERTRTELRLLVKELGITTLFVTHDQEEAFDLSDRVAVMDAGRVRQTGRPEELYDEPADPFVAGFVGRANRLEIRLAVEDGGRTARLPGGGVWPIPDARLGFDFEATAAPTEAELWVRPEDLELLPAEEAALSGTVRDRRFRGAVTVFRVDAGAAGLLEVAGGRDALSAGERVGVAPAEGARLHLFRRDASRLPPGSRARDGGPAGAEDSRGGP